MPQPKRIPKPTALGRLIRRLRTRQSLSLNEAGKRIGIDRATLLRIERGEIAQPGQSVLNALARLFGIEAEDLYDAAWMERRDVLPSPTTYFRRKYRLSADQAMDVHAALMRTTPMKEHHQKQSRKQDRNLPKRSLKSSTTIRNNERRSP